jgi:mono/diheme cytochrome c family protein
MGQCYSADMKSIFLCLLLALYPVRSAWAQASAAGTLYLENCAICHGDDARGPTNPDYQGSILVDNAFVKAQTDEQLIAFLKKGRPADAPDTTMRMLMPPFDYLKEDELKLLVQFMRRVAPSATPAPP